MNQINELYTMLMLSVAALFFTWRIRFFQFTSDVHALLPYPTGKQTLTALILYLGVQMAFIPVLAIFVLVLWSGQLSIEKLLENPGVEEWINFAAAASVAPILGGYAWWKQLPLWEGSALSIKKKLTQLLKGIASWLIAFPLASAAAMIIRLVLQNYVRGLELEQVAVRHLKNAMDFPIAFAFAIFAIILLIPIAEELLFRGFIQNWLRRYLKPPAAITLASIIFAAFHYAPSQGIVNAELLAALFILSCFLGFLYEKEKSLWAPIGLHIAFNAVTVAMIVYELSD